VQPPLDIAALGNPPSYYVSVFVYCWTVGSAILVSGGDYDFGLEFRFMSSGRCSVDLRACLAAAGYLTDDGARALIGGTNEQSGLFFDLIVFFLQFSKLISSTMPQHTTLTSDNDAYTENSFADKTLDYTQRASSIPLARVARRSNSGIRSGARPDPNQLRPSLSHSIRWS
jgi:hypothetical protein